MVEALDTHNIWSINMLKRVLKKEFTAASSVTNCRTGLRICFISSYPPNHARLSEYAKNLVAELANRPSIDKMNVLTDQISISNGGLPENPKVKVVRVWKQDHPLSILGVMVQVLKLKPDVVHFS